MVSGIEEKYNGKKDTSDYLEYVAKEAELYKDFYKKNRETEINRQVNYQNKVIYQNQVNLSKLSNLSKSSNLSI